MADAPMEGVYLCEALDLHALFNETALRYPEFRLRHPDHIDDPARIDFAFAFQPKPDAFARYPNLKLVHSIAAGIYGILACPSLPPDVTVARVRDPDQVAIMAGFAVWHIVWHHRDMRRYLQNETAAKWNRFSFNTMRAPRTVRVGILGAGAMGMAIAKGVATLGFPVTVAARHPREGQEPGIEIVSGAEAARQVASRADILVNVLPLTDETRGLLDIEFLAAMPEGAALVHLGRGEHLDEAALVTALDRGHLSAASLDVFESEPLRPDHPFWSDPRILVTPHEAAVIGANSAIDSLRAALHDIRAGLHPRNAIDRTRGY